MRVGRYDSTTGSCMCSIRTERCSLQWDRYLLICLEQGETKMQLRWLLAMLTLLAAITLCSSCTTSDPVLTDVMADGGAKATATFDGSNDEKGDTGSSATISLSFTNDSFRVLIPAGIVLYASDNNSQRLITAKSVIVAGTSGDNTGRVQVPTYCLDEFRAIPSPQSELSFDAPDGHNLENTDKLKQLADCQ